MLLPPYGLCYLVELVAVIDADTIDVRLWDHVLRVRLVECWADETRGPSATDKGRDAKQYVENLLSGDEPLSLFIPATAGRISEALTLGRILGRLFVGSRELAEILVSNGFATRTKPKAVTAKDAKSAK